MAMPKVAKKIGLFLFLFYGLLLLTSFLLKNHFRQHFSPLSLERMLFSGSQFKDITDNPCQYQIYGDPDTKEYLKVNFYCPSQKSSVNTLALLAVREKTVKGTIETLAKINGFSAKLTENQILSLGNLKSTPEIFWQCFLNQKPVTDYRENVPNQSVLNCYFSPLRKEGENR